MRTVSLALVMILAACSRPAPDQDIRYVIAPAGLNLRAQANASSPAVALLRPGSQVTVIEEQKEESAWQGLTGRWTKVRFEQTEGWAFGAFLSKQKPPTVTGKWGTCVEMVNIGPMNFGPDGSYSSVDIGVQTIGRYAEEGDTVTVHTTHMNAGESYGGIKPLDNPGSFVMRLTPEGTLCGSSGECYCRR